MRLGCSLELVPGKIVKPPMHGPTPQALNTRVLRILRGVSVLEVMNLFDLKLCHVAYTTLFC